MLLSAALSILFAATAFAEEPYKSFVGRFVWNEQASYYALPHEYGKNPLPRFEIFRDDPKTGIKLHETVVMKDGTKIDWRYDDVYDGKPKNDGSITWKMKRLTHDSIGNEWYMNDGSFKGYEVDRIFGDRIVNTGVQIDAKGNMYPYVEVWDRVKE
jgi:hypothetical protein